MQGPTRAQTKAPDVSRVRWNLGLNQNDVEQLFAQLARDELFQFHDVGRELANSFGGFFRRHRIVIYKVAEFFFVELELLNVRLLRHLGTEFSLHWFE